MGEQSNMGGNIFVAAPLLFYPKKLNHKMTLL